MKGEAGSDVDDGNFSIVVEDLSKSYGSFQALKKINFRVQPGEIVGFLGPNGAGKSTTMKVLTCFMAANSGTARVAGFDVHQDPSKVRAHVGYLPENVPLYDEMLVYDYLKFMAEGRHVPRRERKARIREVIAQTGLHEVVSRPVGALSKGFRQRVGLAQAIIHKPEVLILDEPTTGLDPNQISEIRDVITEIGREKTVIFSTHILQEVTAVCDRIIIINRGEIVADGALDELEAVVAAHEPGLRVVFSEASDVTETHNMLVELPGVDAVRVVPHRPGQHAFLLQTSMAAQVRQRLFEREANHPGELISLVPAEPTLEEVFQIYTAGATQEGAGASREAS